MKLTIYQSFLKKVYKHVLMVNICGSYINMKFPNHDKDKLKSWHITFPYAINYFFKDKIDLSRCQKTKAAINKASYIHVKTNKHHPEYWTNQELNDWNRFNKDGEETSILVDATKMPDRYIKEMCCDWTSASIGDGNSAIDWADKNIGTRWKFTEDQTKLIYDTLELLHTKRQKVIDHATI